MFERMTDDARAVLLAAQEQARDLGHNWVGTEHLLLGLAAQRNGIAADVLSEVGVDLPSLRTAVVAILGPASADSPLVLDEDDVALRSVGIDLNAVRAKVEEVFGRGALERPVPAGRRRRGWLRRGRRGCRHSGGGSLHRPFAPRAKKSLEMALRESLALGHRWIGPEHVLLGVLRVPDCLAAAILARQGVRLDDLAGRVRARLGRVA